MNENTTVKTPFVTNTEDKISFTIDKKKFKKIAIITGSTIAAVGAVAFLTNVSASVDADLSIEPLTTDSDDSSTTE